MSAYLRAAKPILSYLAGTKFITMRRNAFKRKRFGSSGRSLSVGSAVEPDGTRVVKSRYGKIRKTKGVALSLKKKLTPILTHIQTGDGNLKKTTSGHAIWKILPVGTPTDVKDMMNKGDAVLANIGAPQLYQQGMYFGNQGRVNVYSHDTMMNIKNQNTNTVTLTCYECVARENIVANGGGNSSLDNIFTTGWAKTSASSGVIGDMDPDDVDSTLYQNPLWCHYFKITRARTFSLKPGENIKFNMQHGKAKCVNTLELGSDPEILAMRGFTRIMVFKLVGGLVSVRTGWSGAGPSIVTGVPLDIVVPVVGTEVDTGTINCDFRFVKKFRWNYLSYAGDWITQTDGDAPENADPAMETDINVLNGNQNKLPAEL